MSTEKVIAYKGFDKDLKCRGFQYEVGKEYVHDGGVEVCSSGFHACIDPFDVLSYYDITQRFAVVELNGVADQKHEDSKVAAKSITVVKELTLSGYVTACFQSLYVEPSDAASGHYSQLAASGRNSQLAASGDDSQLAASGTYSKLAASGYNSNLAASGNFSNLAASGDDSKLAASGDDSVAMSAGLRSRAKVGKNGVMALTWKDFSDRLRVSVAYVGEDGILEDTWYAIDASGNFIISEE